MPKGIYDRSKSKPRRKTGGRPAENGISPEDAIACLTCTAKKCTGAYACFKRRKKETTK
jgi:hypothetical protein